jgi:hypothetical protein
MTGGTVLKKGQDSESEVGPDTDQDKVVVGNDQTAGEQNADN